MSFLTYIYDLGVESSKTMNIIYSMSNSTTSVSSFYAGYQFSNTSVLINNAVRGLPQIATSITSPLLYQIAIARSFDAGVYFGSFPSVTGSNIVSSERVKFTKIIPNITLSSIQMIPSNSYEIINEINQSDFRPAFLKNSSHYYDNQNFYYINYYNTYYAPEYLSFGYSAYNKTTANSTFGISLYNIISVSTNEINSLSSSLNASFNAMIQQMSLFSNESYNSAGLLSNFCDNNVVVQESFLNFANINLSV